MAECICRPLEHVSESEVIMSLLSKAFEAFTVVNKSVVDDGYGGTTTVWTDGATIQGALVFDNSAQMKVAAAMGAKGAYTLTVRKNVELDYHTVLRRSNGQLFRLISNSDDKRTPEGSTLDMRQYTAEEYTI